MRQPPNSDTAVHLWEDDLKVTLCGLPKEIVIPVTQRHGAVVWQCQDCYHLAAGHIHMNPTPAEAAFLEVFFPDA